jgi:hypothetical protein
MAAAAPTGVRRSFQSLQISQDIYGKAARVKANDNIVGIKWTSTGTIRHRCSVRDSSRSSLAVSPRDRQLPVSILMLCICTITPQAVSVSIIRLRPVQWSWSPSWTYASSAKRNGKTGTTDCEYFLLIKLLVRTTSHQKFNRLLLKDKSLPSHTQRITAPQSLQISKSTM